MLRHALDAYCRLFEQNDARLLCIYKRAVHLHLISIFIVVSLALSSASRASVLYSRLALA